MDTGSSSTQPPKLKKKASKVKDKDEPATQAVVITDGSEPPRTGRACLACRKLKVRCLAFAL